MGAEVISTILGAITSFLGGIGTAIVGFFSEVVTNAEGGLSDMAIWILVFLGLSIAIGLGRLVFAIFRTRR